MKTTLSQEIVVYGISKHKPPKDILEQFLNYLPDSEKSVNLALKLYCHKFVIQHYINQKDRLSLISYKARLAPHEDEYFLIENALQSVSIPFFQITSIVRELSHPTQFFYSLQLKN